MDSLLAPLNAEQKKAVTSTDGPVLIVAGAGAGKTKTLTTRIAYIIASGKTDPNRILAITFTNKAAKEMRERAYKLIEKNLSFDDQGPLITTFHSLGVHILKEWHHLMTRGKYFSILDSDDSLALIKESIRESGLDPKQYEPKKFQAIISRYKGRGVSFFQFNEYIESSYDELVKDVWDKYEKKLEKEKAYDFDDLLLKPLTLLKSNAHVRDHYQKIFEYIHIDEYQDTNGVQYELVKLLVNENKNICAVGDTDQNIYSWRGAQIKNMLLFEKDFPNTTTIFLEENYRSTDVILSAANRVIEKNEMRIPKNLFTKKGFGEKITVAELYSERDESLFVIDEVINLWDQKVSLEDIAILFRANFQSRVFEEACIARGLPYTMTGTKFYERKEIKDVLSYLKAARNQDSWTDIKRCINTPTRGIGKTSILKLVEGKKDELPQKTKEEVRKFYDLLEKIKVSSEQDVPSVVIKKIITDTGLYDLYDPKTEDGEMRRENMEELVSLAKNYDENPNGMDAFLTDALLQSDQDTLSLEKSKKGVRLMTVHAAKGLEFSHVFIVGLEHGLFPHQRDERQKKEDQEEERRLFYVALTRAKEKLFLSYATTRTIFGMRGVQTPSEFLYDIPSELIEQAKKDRPSSGEVTIYID
jgi:DNA helicase-2/ATP-dependent DNA helicase PcrA